jgi:hypothetical protein
VDPVPDPLLLRKRVALGIETGISGSLAKNTAKLQWLEDPSVTYEAETFEELKKRQYL